MNSDMFMRMDDIDSVDSVHKGATKVLSWRWVMSQSGSAHRGPGSGSGKVSVRDLSFTTDDHSFLQPYS